MKYLYLTTITGVMIYALYSSLAGYLDLPIVAFNQAGECVYIDTAQGRQNCDIIPMRHTYEYVK